ncbi:AmpG family muropeptide MFS transporter [Rickettsia prowazekii]|uniref:Putative transporter AmpG 2 n=1 Tax=Rickettsia prowazekii (strain Madrid E) TaxID=272947 RepID=AMPG2_RICPR|nr:AmpG family muropeptide MFS transporter [Rickettsia prowazekii]Q9ZCQ1.1 RecName: Full=Putative transporter AmpG 2 [Rickettsia prowazekii str. Madrid E]AMS12547.1 transporter [Rickettsia prowazekii]CAA15106.1 AMPG PROTEIN (ampG2) [Rickettsia prowazekii str. Madrid E]
MNFKFARFKSIFNILFILIIAFPGGLIYLLTGSTLSFWLRESDFDKITIGLFGLVNFIHIFKFLWGPLLEKISFSTLSNRGYKYCLVITLINCIFCVYVLTSFNPNTNFIPFVLCLVVLAFFSSIYDMLIQSSQMLLITDKNWGISEAACTTGFRIGILISGSGALYLSTIISWQDVYRTMAILCIPSLLLIIFYPLKFKDKIIDNDFDRFLNAFYDFIKKPKCIVIISFMLLYRLQDSFLSIMPNMFYLDIGYTKQDLAVGYKAFGMCATIFGGVIGGFLCRKYEYSYLLKRVLIYHALSSLSFIYLYFLNQDITSLYIAVFCQEFTKGLTMSPFFSYQLKCCSSRYCITQIALITSITNVGTILIGSISGYAATYLGWSYFFIVAGLCFIPAYILILYLPKTINSV